MRSLSLVIIITALAMPVAATEPYHQYDAEPAFTIGPDEGLVYGVPDPRLGFIEGFSFVDEHTIVLSDVSNDALTFVDTRSRTVIERVEEAEGRSEVYVSLSSGHLYGERGIWGQMRGSMVDRDRDVQYMIEYAIFRGTRLQGHGEVVPFPSIVFVYDQAGHIHSILHPTTDTGENRRNTLNSDATRALFTNNDEVIPEGLTIDEQDRLFLNSELVTRDYEVFLAYFIERYSHRGPYGLLEEHAFRLTASEFMPLVGRDGDGNWYWYNGFSKQIIIFDESGFVIDRFPLNPDQSLTIPAVHPSGDVYTLSFDDDGVTVWRIERRW